MADTINFNLRSSAASILLTSAQLPTITDVAGLTIDGGSADITISGANQYRVFEVGSGAKLTLSNLTVADGSSTSGGGGIYNYFGTLTVSNSTFSGNSATDDSGGGKFNYGEMLTVSNSTLSGNGANGEGGGINDWVGTATLKTTILANSPSGGNCLGTITNGGYNLDSGTRSCARR